ncbi:amidase [Lapillicoccus jejuensis]|uniref:Aspartyl-tRNA(Asn)/glutamyl-tRNA(Gln) amidotransferase subunit A n=1 Tax=Lapillicoccus jejuensis TaxID=402171 RepID=A0A542E6X6_9MICO|nr:amidase [Lapillicoccus jejuensis]TQJ11064.1 aspartyl-tRNA(Asn)/glutamyl-tRNA(Gln) amidotransferase subunit A [Lapillicoccus jejuensis]
MSSDQSVLETARLTARELTARYAAGTLSPPDVLAAVEAVVDAREPELNAFWVRSSDTAAREAEASARRWAQGRALGPLDGVPVTLKENLARAGVPMPAGHAGADPVVPQRSSPVADRVTEAGGVVLGSTVMPDWGMLSSGVSSRHGITRSPWDPSWTTGGSSSGAGAAAAAGYAPLNVGTDIGGSIRLPGTWLGLATLKPSAGRVPLDAPYLGRVAGPLCRTVDDCALLMSVLARPDARDWTALPTTPIDWDDRTLDVSALRVGVLFDAGCGMDVDPEVASAVGLVADTFAAAGARIEPMSAWMEPRLLADLDLFWRVRSLVDHEALTPEGRERILPFVSRWVSNAAGASGTDVLRAYGSIMEIQRRTVAATEAYDVVLSPVAPVAAFPAEWPMPFGDEDRGMAHIGFTAPYNLSGQPAATVNCGFTADGRPVGVQLGGRRFDDIGVLAVARWYEAARPAAAVPAFPVTLGDRAA